MRTLYSRYRSSIVMWLCSGMHLYLHSIYTVMIIIILTTTNTTNLTL